MEGLGRVRSFNEPVIVCIFIILRSANYLLCGVQQRVNDLKAAWVGHARKYLWF